MAKSRRTKRKLRKTVYRKLRRKGWKARHASRFAAKAVARPKRTRRKARRR